MNRFLDGFSTKFKLPVFGKLQVKDMEAKPKIVSFALEFCQTSLLVLSTHLLTCRFLPFSLFAQKRLLLRQCFHDATLALLLK